MKSASSAPPLYKSGWTWWTSGPVTIEDEGGRGRLGDLFKGSLPKEKKGTRDVTTNNVDKMMNCRLYMLHVIDLIS